MKDTIKYFFLLNQSVSNKTRKKYPYLIFLTIFCSFFEVMTIGSIIPVITLLVFPENLYNIDFLKIFIEKNNINIDNLRIYIITLFLVLILISTLFRVMLLYLNLYLSKLITSDISTALFKSYIYKSYEEISLFKSNKIIANTTEKLEVFSNLLFHIFSFFSSIILSVSIIVSLIIFSNLLVIFSLIIAISIVYIILVQLTKNKLDNYSNYTNKLSNKRAKNLQNCLNNYKNIILENSMDAYTNFFFDLDHNYRKIQARVAIIGFLPRYLIEGLAIISITLIAFIFLEKNDFQNNANIILSLGVLVYGAQKLLPIFQSIYLAFTSIKGNAELIKEISISVDTNKNSFNKEIKYNNEEFHSLELRDINFKYKDSIHILSKINLKINKGDKIAIIGQSGSGKSTLVDLIMGLLKPTNGNVFLNNSKTNYDDDKFRIRSHFSHVPQNYFILNETLQDNVLFSISKNKTINDQNFEKAIKCSQLTKFVENYKKGKDALIGDKGLNISGGQRQRVALARALYQDKNILVLDEATSSLDQSTEDLFLKELDILYPGLTVIFITHKKNLLNRFNKIVNLDEKTI